MQTKNHRCGLGLKWPLAALAFTPLLAAGCARQAQSPMATETPAQLQQSIQQHAQSYQTYMQGHPNAYNTQGSHYVYKPGGQ